MCNKNKTSGFRRAFCILLALVIFPLALAAQDSPKLVPALGWDRDKQGGFVTCVPLICRTISGPAPRGEGCGATMPAKRNGRISW